MLCGDNMWSIDLPKGDYDVTIGVGDFDNASTHIIQINNVDFIKVDLMENKFY